MTYKIPQSGEGVRLHLNENSAGCSPAVTAALRNIRPDDVAKYLDHQSFTDTTARWFGVDPAWVLLVNGLDEGLSLAALATAKENRRRATFSGENDARRRSFFAPALIVEPAFEMYRVCAEIAGLEVWTLRFGPDFAFPLDALVAAARDAALVYLTDPNNPTGLPIPEGALATLAEAAPDTRILVDEAYADFSGRTIIGPLLDRHRNLICGRTFAKGHGLAAMRIGALVAHPDALAPLRDCCLPFNVSLGALRALEAALGDDAWLQAYVAAVRESKARIYDFCDRRGLQYWRSDGNFVLIRVGSDASAIVGRMAAHGILIRDRSNAPDCEGCIRITAGTIEATTTCLTTLEEVLETRND